jgi:hypothetical protein
VTGFEIPRKLILRSVMQKSHLMLKQILFFSFLATTTFFFMQGCSEEKNACDLAIVNPLKPLAITLERKEKELFALKDLSELQRFVMNNPAYADFFLNRREYPHDSLFIQSLYKLVHDPYLDTVYHEVDAHFGNMENFQKELGQAFARLQQYYPGFKVPLIQTGITGFATDLYVSDTLIIIGLDFFLGRHGRFRPQNYPQYIVERFEEEYIIPNIILHLSKYFNEQDPMDETFLADMIFYGKSYVFTQSILPCTEDALLIQYKPEVLTEVRENEEIIWASLLENELLYETNHFVKKKFLEERPSIPEIGTKCPGRIGAWVGWRVVISFCNENASIDIPDLMKMKDAESIFRESGYKPGN